MKIDPRVAAFLAECELAQYASAFRLNHISFEMLLTLTDAELVAIGVVSLGHRKRILALADLRTERSRAVGFPEATLPRATLPLVADGPESADSMHDGIGPPEGVVSKGSPSGPPHTSSAATNPPPQVSGTNSEGTSAALFSELPCQAQASPLEARTTGTALDGAAAFPQSSSTSSGDVANGDGAERSGEQAVAIQDVKRIKARWPIAVLGVAAFGAIVLAVSRPSGAPSNAVDGSSETPKLEVPLTDCEVALADCRAVSQMSVASGQDGSSLLLADVYCQAIRKATAGHAGIERQLAEYHRIGNNSFDRTLEGGMRGYLEVCRRWRTKLHQTVYIPK